MNTTNNNDNAIDLVNTEQVNILDENGVVTETFHFPVIPRVIVVEDLSDTETEKEQEKEEVEEEQAREEEEDEENVASTQAEVEKAEEAKEAQYEKKAKEEAEAVKQRVFIVSEPTPARSRSPIDSNSNFSRLQPTPTMTPAPIPSDLFPLLELPKVSSKLQLEIELNNAMASTSPVLAPVLINLSPPTSPLPLLDFSLDIVDF